jgi:hypothetical protein
LLGPGSSTQRMAYQTVDRKAQRFVFPVASSPGHRVEASGVRL